MHCDLAVKVNCSAPDGGLLYIVSGIRVIHYTYTLLDLIYYHQTGSSLELTRSSRPPHITQRSRVGDIRFRNGTLGWEPLCQDFLAFGVHCSGPSVQVTTASKSLGRLFSRPLRVSTPNKFDQQDIGGISVPDLRLGKETH